MALMYATPDDVQAWCGDDFDVPDNITRLIRSASQLVRHATKTAIYAVDNTTHLPTGATVAQAFNDAVCATVEGWVAAGIDPLTEGMDLAAASPVLSASFNGAAYTTSAPATALAARVDAANCLTGQSLRILGDAGLLNQQPGYPWAEFDDITGQPVTGWYDVAVL